MPILSNVGPAGLADGTINDLVRATQRHLNGITRPELTKSTNALTASPTSTTVTLTYPSTGVRAGSIISIDDELMYVWTVASSVATVERGWEGTPIAAHAAGALIEVEPSFPRSHILQSLRDEVLSWGPQVYRVVQTVITTTSGDRAFPLPAANVVKVLDVWASHPTGRSTPRRVQFQHLANQDISRFPTGHAITIVSPQDTGIELYVSYATPFPISDFASDTPISTVGLPDSVLDIPPMGAAWRIMTMREVQRNALDAQGQTRTPDNVPASALMRTGAGLKALRDQRLDEEANRLNQRYAWRI